MPNSQEYWICEVEGPRAAAADRPAAGPVYRNINAQEKLASLDIGTLYELFQRSVSRYGDRPCLGRRAMVDGAPGEYTWLTYNEVSAQVDALGSALKQVGLMPKGRVGIFGVNSPEWMMAMQACNRHSLYAVPLYDSLGENAIEYIVEHSESTAVFSSADKLPALVKALPKLTARVKTVVYWGAADAAQVAAAQASGVTLYSFAEFLALGTAQPAPAEPPSPEDICTIMYTSGTTGDPKGVLLTHKALVTTGAGQLAFQEQVGITLDHTDCILSYLPLAHIFDRVAEETFLYLGARIGYWRGDIKGLVDDIAALKPTVFIGVPRVYDRIYAGVLAKIKAAGGIKSWLFHFGFRRKQAALARGVSFNKASPFFDSLVFNKIKVRLGGNVRLIISGGAPLARHVEEFLKVAMCSPVVQGYGLTETCAASFVAVPDNPAMVGTVGPPMASLEMRLEAVPEMNYSPTADPPRGEVCVRGNVLFNGYYKAQDKTDEVMDADGWFHTGDVGEITSVGALKIIDRKKNIFKLSQGEYIAVEKIEAVYKKNPLVEQIWVYGNSFESTLVAVVVPAEEVLGTWAQANGLQGGLSEWVKSDKARAYVLAELTATAKEGKLKGFEMVKALALESDPWTVENNMFTPTFKHKRPQLQAKYQAQIDALYKQMNGK